MKLDYKNYIMALLVVFALAGCDSSLLPSSGVSTDSFVYKGINFGVDRNEDYKHGVRDGCDTAGGKYTKDHTAFRSNQSYKDGWEHGRLMCNPSTKQ